MVRIDAAPNTEVARIPVGVNEFAHMFDVFVSGGGRVWIASNFVYAIDPDTHQVAQGVGSSGLGIAFRP